MCCAVLPVGRLNNMSSKPRKSTGASQVKVAMMSADPTNPLDQDAPASKKSKHSSTLAGQAAPQAAPGKTGKVR